MEYYDEAQFIAKVTSKDATSGRIERWDAHKMSILHRGITISIYIGDLILLQYRKHPVFDMVYDATISTHPIYNKGMLQKDEEAILLSLKRELNVSQKNLFEKPKLQGKIIYKAKDPSSKYTENEVCRVYKCKIDKFPNFNKDFAYDLIQCNKSELHTYNGKLIDKLAPWVKVMLEKNLI